MVSPVPEPPSPKFHVSVSGSLSGSLALDRNVKFVCPAMPVPFGVTTKPPEGGLFFVRSTAAVTAPAPATPTQSHLFELQPPAEVPWPPVCFEVSTVLVSLTFTIAFRRADTVMIREFSRYPLLTTRTRCLPAATRGISIGVSPKTRPSTNIDARSGSLAIDKLPIEWTSLAVSAQPTPTATQAANAVERIFEATDGQPYRR